MQARNVAVALLVGLTPALSPTFALAQTAEDPVIKAARARFNEGVDFYDKGQYENARAAFLQAYALRKHPSVLLNLAQSALRSGHTLEAARSFEQYLRESASLSAAQRGDAETGLADARTKLGRLEISAPPGTEIEIDGERAGAAPLPEAVDVNPGSHTVTSNLDTKTLTVAAGQVEPVTLATAAAPPPPHEPAAVFPAEAPLPVASTEEETRPGLLSPPKDTAPAWIGLGVGMAGGATAILFAVFKSQASSNAAIVSRQITNAANTSGTAMTLCLTPSSQSFQEACQTLRNDNHLLDTDAIVANVGLGVGIAGIAFSLGWYLFASKRDATPAAATASGAFIPIVSPHLDGLGYAGSF